VKRFEADFINKRLYTRLDPMFEGYFVSPTLEFYAPAAAGSRASTPAKDPAGKAPDAGRASPED
jgi:hypothetical protein